MFYVGLVSYLTTAVAFGLLTAILMGQWQVKPLGPTLIAASAATVIWSGIIAAGTTMDYPPVTAINVGELLRDAAWLFFLLQLSALQSSGGDAQLLGGRWRQAFVAGAVVGLVVVALRPLRDVIPVIPADLPANATLTLWLLASITGLFLLEQIYRNASTAQRWGLKYLCLGLGVLFIYDFFMYAQALLFRQLDPNLWQSRGLVNALIVPVMAVAIRRVRAWRMEVYVSRQVVFHTITLVGSGFYLIAMAAAGYAINYLGGSWGGVLQVSFIVAACVLLGSLLFSESLRAKLRVYLSKNFFRNRYDYREEWLKFTEGLEAIDGDLGVGIVRNLAPMVMSDGGALFARDAAGNLRPTASVNLKINDISPSLAEWKALTAWLEDTGWVIDIDEWRQSPKTYGDLQVPDSLASVPDAWLVVPLLFQSELEGLIIVRKTPHLSRLVWEDRDLLKTAGRQAASFLAQARASDALVEARQFDAFNRLSAYVVHDLKNILAQQSLLVTNARKHRDNPAFIDDMISTVENSVNRMQRLMEQMRSGLRNPVSGAVGLRKTLLDVVTQRAVMQPAPEARLPEEEIWVTADPHRLATVFAHLVQNAQESTESAENKASVTIDVTQDADSVRVIVRDTGVGMTDAFIRERLFKPFESTKGLTGMGIGAFESREYVRQLGGDIAVDSIPGDGSVFTVTLPRALVETSVGEGYDVAHAK